MSVALFCILVVLLTSTAPYLVSIYYTAVHIYYEVTEEHYNPLEPLSDDD